MYRHFYHSTLCYQSIRYEIALIREWCPSLTIFKRPDLLEGLAMHNSICLVQEDS